MVSSTVRAGNRRASWNERPRPRQARSATERPEMSSSPRSTVPRSAGTKPEIRSNSVVLPAPLGPMMPTISPGRGREGDVVDRGQAAEAPGEAVDGDGRARSRRRGRSALAAGRTLALGWRGPVGPGALQEHRAQQVGPLEQLGGGPLEADLALLHEVGPVGHREGHVHRLLDEDHRGPVVADLPHQRQEALDDHRGQAEGELVDHEQLGAGDERHAQGEHLLLAAGQVAGGLVASLAQDREELDGAGPGGLGALRVVLAPQPAGQAQVLVHGEGREDARPAGHLHDAPGGDLVRRGVGDVGPVEDDRAAVGLDHAADGLQQGGLAGAVGAEQGHDLALVAPRRSTPKSTCTSS